MAALDAFAGEREARTLETLLVQPVPGRELGRGKFGAVLLTGLAALVGNVLSLVLCAAAGLGDLPGGAFFSHASAVSGDGAVIVGAGFDAAGSQAVLWSGGGPVELAGSAERAA